jgi:peptide/nickel transport system substrate-binding protein
MHGPRPIVVAVLFALGASTSCGTSSNSVVVPAVARGGTLRVADVGPQGSPDATTLDPVLNSASGTLEYLRCCVGRTLLSYNGKPTADGGANLHPDLAVAMPTVAADGLTWTFRVRAGIHYAPPFQRTEITAADFVRTLERDTNLSSVTLLPFYSVIKGFTEFAAGKTSTIAGLETPDAHTLVVRLTQPTGDLGYRFSLSLLLPTPALPSNRSAQYGVATGHDDGYGGFLVASGPYMVEGSGNLDFSLPPNQQKPASGLVPGQSLTLVRNPSWSAASDSLRAAYVDRIVILPSTTRAEAAALVDSGSADLAMYAGPPPGAPLDQIRAYQANTSLGRVDLRAQDSILYLSMNLAVPPFDDIHVRRAVAYAIDRPAALAAFGSLNGSVTGHIAPDSMEDNALLTYDPFLKADAASRLEAAKAEMRQSRYDADGDGICDVPACRNFRVLGISSPQDISRPPLEETIPAALTGIGLIADLQQVSPQNFFTQLGDPTTHTPMGIGMEFGKDYPNGGDFFGVLFASSAITLATGANFSLIGATPDQLRTWGYSVSTVPSVPSVDDRIAQCIPLVGASQTRCWTALDQYLVTEVVPVIPLVSINSVQVVPSRVVNYSFDQYAVLPALDRIAVKH